MKRRATAFKALASFFLNGALAPGFRIQQTFSPINPRHRSYKNYF
jgi:hypothetical protein